MRIWNRRARVIIKRGTSLNKGGRMKVLAWLFFSAVGAGFLAWIVSGIIRIGNRRAAASKKLEARPVGEYAAYLAGTSDPRD